MMGVLQADLRYGRFLGSSTFLGRCVKVLQCQQQFRHETCEVGKNTSGLPLKCVFKMCTSELQVWNLEMVMKFYWQIYLQHVDYYWLPFFTMVKESYKTRHFCNQCFSSFSSWDLYFFSILFLSIFFICRIETFSDLLRVFHLAPYYRRFFLGDSLILIVATIMAEPFQCIVSAVVFIIFLISFIRHSEACVMVPFCASSIT